MMNKSKTIGNTHVYVALGLFLLAALGYFRFIGNYVLFFQETQSLFTFTGEYLHQFLLKPGGLLEYAAKFLTQFYHDKFTGSLILSVILVLPGVVLYLINNRLIPGIYFSLIFLLIPSFLLMIMQANYYHMMEYNLGILIILVYYLFTLSAGEKYQPVAVLILFPLVYYLAGAYALIFAGLYTVHCLALGKKSQRFINPLFLLVIALATFLVSWKVVFLQSAGQLILYPLPLLKSADYKIYIIILASFLVVYPLLCRIAIRVKQTRLNSMIYTFISLITVTAVFTSLLIKTNNPQTSRVIELERLIFGEKWEEAIAYHEKKPSRNLIGQYFYNIALSETDQLCERLFFGRQDFGTGSLVLPWGVEHLDRGGYFYYSIGLINEAHRWAYEEMVVYGYRPQNLKLLVKTSLINGDITMARKYLNILKKTIYYRDWAMNYEKIADNPGLISAHPELGAKIKIVPKNNFFIQLSEPQANLPLILEAQPDNRKAFEYYLAGLLLTKNVEVVMKNIIKMNDVNYTTIPRHIEEAVIVYYNSTREFPDLGGLSLSNETRARFDNYFTNYMAGRQNPAALKVRLEEKFGNTFWYYFHFK